MCCCPRLPLIEPAGGVPPTTAFADNNGGAPATFSASDSFAFGSAWLATTDGSSPMTVEVVGLLGGKVVDRMMIVLRGPIQQIFNWSGIDGVRFVPQTLASSNGKLHALSQMVINGVTASVPEPASMLLLGSGVGLAITRLRRLRQHK